MLCGGLGVVWLSGVHAFLCGPEGYDVWGSSFLGSLGDIIHSTTVGSCHVGYHTWHGRSYIMYLGQS